MRWLDPLTKREFYIIAKGDLQDGHYYVGHCRNAHLARWDAKAGVFKHWREKFGLRFVEAIEHPEDARGPLDVFIVTDYGCPPEGIPLED